MGGASFKQIRDGVAWVTSEQMLLFYLHGFKKAFWQPDGMAKVKAKGGVSKAETREALVRNLPEMLVTLVGQQAARAMLGRTPHGTSGARGTIVFTNASAAFKGYPKSAAFAMACHAKTGLVQSMARELMPQGVHVVQVPVDAAIGNANPEGEGRRHWLMGDTVDDNMADPERIAELYLQLHRQHRSTWTSEVVVRPWVENW